MADRSKLNEMLGAPERRSVAVDDFEVRKDGDTLTLTGHASVFDTPYDVFGGPERGGWTETVDRRAFDKTLREKPDVHLLVNHEGMPLARTKSGTLALSTDKRGLRVETPKGLDRRDPDVQRLEVKMERRDIDEMSMAFRTIEHRWNEDESERRLMEVSLHRGDVSVVNFGASPTTNAQLRSMLSFLDDLDFDDALAEVRALDDPLEQLRAARETLDRLLREATPPEKRTLSLVEARKLIDA